MSDGTCKRCGSPLPPYKGGRRRKWCSDRCRRRWQDENMYRAACVDCDADLAPGSRRSGAVRCAPCYQALRRREVDNRAQQIVGWWAQGKSMREIAALLGWADQDDGGKNHLGGEIARLRTKGYDLPHRYSGYDREAA